MTRWNNTIQCFPPLLDAVPAGAQRALDVGCGEGVFTRALAKVVHQVVGIDPDGPSIELAREAGGADYLLGDFLEHRFEPASFDYVSAVGSLHHMDTAAAVERMVGLLRPGGAIGIVGFGRRDWPRDLPRDVVDTIVTRRWMHTGGRKLWETPSPKIWPPPRTYRDERALLESLLPGVDFRRRTFRYTAVWVSRAAR